MQELLLIRMLMPMVSRYSLDDSLTNLFISNLMVFLTFSWFSDDLDPAHLSLQFRVFLRNAATKRYTQEKRVISYWFKLAFSPMQQASAAQDFFKQLVSPSDFPRGMIISEYRALNRFIYTMLCLLIFNNVFLFSRLRRFHKEDYEINAKRISHDC